MYVGMLDNTGIGHLNWLLVGIKINHGQSNQSIRRKKRGLWVVSIAGVTKVVDKRYLCECLEFMWVLRGLVV